MRIEDGVVRVTDCMPPRACGAHLVRIVEGPRGRVPMRMELTIRLDYGATTPWVTREEGGLRAVQGPDALRLRTPVPVRGERTVADSFVEEADRVPFVLAWQPSHEPPAAAIDPFTTVDDAAAWWEAWSERCTYAGEWALTLSALLRSGYGEEALAFRDWVLQATAGAPADAQIMYGIAGERRIPESELDWLPGCERSRPVRAGNAAVDVFQLDVYGELLDVGHLGRLAARERGFDVHETVQPAIWRRNLALPDFVETVWREPDEGIWEVRGPRRHFTYSKVMAWVAFDRAVRAVEEFGLHGPVDRWRRLRAEVRDEVCRDGYDPERNTFTQSFGSPELDASLLLIPAVAFLEPGDPRVRGTVEAIERELVEDGFVYRYATGRGEGAVDGLPGREGAFLPCSFWLVDALAMIGRTAEARGLFERLLAVRNDLGLLAEEYDPASARLVGNFPQAFSHLALVNSANRLSGEGATP